MTTQATTPATVPSVTQTGTQAPPTAAQVPPSNPVLDAKLAEMTTRMASASDFDAKNKVFHEYFDAVPESDQATRQAFFLTFIGNIPKADADRVFQFLAALDKAKGGGDSTPAAPATTPPAPNGSTAPQGVLMIGDSLSVGTDPFFGDEQTGVSTQVDAKSGRNLAQGMEIYDATAVKPRVVEMALFTNNSPNQIDQLRSAVEKTITDARARGGRVVWATIVGNPRGGDYGPVNAMLRDFAAKNPDVMGLVDWAQMTQQNTSFLAGDGYHGTPAGYRARAEAFAAESRK